MKLICISLLLFIWVSPMWTTPCKTVVRIKKQAMEYACQTQRRPLQKAFGIIPIPELHEKKSSGGGILGNILNNGGLIGAGQKLLGNVVNLVGIKILEVNLPELNVKLVPNIGVQVSVDTNLHISGNLVIVGGIELKVGAGVLADVRVSKTKGGFPILAVTACKSILGDIDITVGGFGLLRPIVRAIQGHIHAILGERLCVSVSNVFLGLNADLGLMAGITPISEDMGLQYIVENPPVVTDDYMDMEMNAEYSVNEQVIELPTGDQEFTLPPGAGSQDSMVNMGFSQDFFISLFIAFQNSGGFNLNIPSTYASLENHLSTSALGSLIPEISRKYPQSLPVKIKIVLSKTPIVSFQSNQLIVQITPSVEMAVVLPNSKCQHLLTVNVGATLLASLDVKGGKMKTSVALTGDLNLAFVSVSYGQSKCNPSMLSGYLRTLFVKAYLLQINEALSIGVSLPSLPNVQLIHQVIDVKENYAIMSCDLQYIN
ncbi:BPI fold-containing family B member 2-like [Pelobates fuscus]|uniref:BPI fold-containing family B member 2-like n=1 Tax=Pelobates fuscus TaxID=191477 RepID=UPI002FE44183